jgi:glycolate oxidase iron-sulfur subunit
MKTPAPAEDRIPSSLSQVVEPDLLTSCVHCGLCLEDCPTYRLTGDENNSPRGRLRLWREETAGQLAADPWTVFYTAECVGCLACETACPANVPYGEILEHIRRDQVASSRAHPKWFLRGAAVLAGHPDLLNLALMPARFLRRWRLLPHPLVFPGRPTVTESTAAYARRLMRARRPTGPRVALLTGCLMEALFREINHATVRVLIEHNVQVTVPRGQGCCGAFQDHLGLHGVEWLRERNCQVFRRDSVDAIVTNSSGCGRALAHALAGTPPVKDVLGFLSELGPLRRTRADDATRVYVDLPCHLIHGLSRDGIPADVLDATGYRWELAPLADECCGSGGVYNLQKPDNARQILARKAAFLNEAAGDPVILATANHVCMMQWHSAARSGLVTRPYRVQHVVQLLDRQTEPG